MNTLIKFGWKFSSCFMSGRGRNVCNENYFELEIPADCPDMNQPRILFNEPMLVNQYIS